MSFNPFEGASNQRAQHEKDVLSGHHSSDLFDQNEDLAGEKINLANGMPIVNDNDSMEAARMALSAVEAGAEDALPDLEEEDDAAAKWLRANGG